MFRVQENQLETFYECAVHLAVKSLTKELRIRNPELLALPEETLERNVYDAAKKARSYGLFSKADIRSFVRLTVACGLRVSLMPTFRELIKNEKADPRTRMLDLALRASVDEWFSASQPSTRD